MSEHTDLFSDRIVSVYVTGHENRGAIMHDCSLQTIAGRTFLCGTCVEQHPTKKKSDHWMAGLEAGFPWDTVASFFLMTPEQFEKRGGG